MNSFAAAKTAPLRPGRPADRQERIAREWRRRIVEGIVPPGGRLPTREEIAREYGAGPHTVQRALDVLMTEGFAVSQGRMGTFVAKRPPHLFHFALVFPAQPTEPGRWVRFWTALDSVAEEVGAQQGYCINRYYGVGEAFGPGDFQRLTDDSILRRVAGVVFASWPYHLAGTPILNAPGVARVSVMRRQKSGAIAGVKLDGTSFFSKAAQYLRNQGCRSVALVLPPGMERVQPDIPQIMAAHGLQSPDYWTQVVHLGVPEAAFRLTRLLMANPSERPESFIVADDNLVEYVTGALVPFSAMATPPLVVAHCNYPCLSPTAVPVRRLGFDAREVLSLALHSVNPRAQSGARKNANVEARFQEEVPPVLCQKRSPVS